MVSPDVQPLPVTQLAVPVEVDPTLAVVLTTMSDAPATYDESGLVVQPVPLALRALKILKLFKLPESVIVIVTRDGLVFCSLHATELLVTFADALSVTLQESVPLLVVAADTVDVTAVVAAVEAVRVPVPFVLTIDQR
jgi:hypothetical protein